MCGIAYKKEGGCRLQKQVYIRRRKNLRSGLAFGIAVILLVFLTLRLDRAIRPNLCAFCESEVRAFAAEMMAESVKQVLTEQNYSYDSMTNLIYNTDGAVAAVETRTDSVNQLQSAIYIALQSKLAGCRDATMKISLGTASGVWLFAGTGPKIPVRLLPVGNGSVRIISELHAAGINQTCHTIRVVATAEITAAIPFSKTTVTTDYEYLLSETILVGSVPESYLEFHGNAP